MAPRQTAVVAVLPEGQEVERLPAFSALQRAAKDLSIIVEPVAFEPLDFGETTVLDRFYNADVVVADMTRREQQAPLFYLLGVRESFGNSHNIVLFQDKDHDDTTSMKARSLQIFLQHTIVNVESRVMPH